MAVRDEPILVRLNPATEEHVGAAIAIEVSDSHRRSILEDRRNSIPRALELSVAVIQVESRTQSVLRSREFVATARHQEIEKPVAVGVQKIRAGVLDDAVRRKRRLCRRLEGSVA